MPSLTILRANILITCLCFLANNVSADEIIKTGDDVKICGIIRITNTCPRNYNGSCPDGLIYRGMFLDLRGIVGIKDVEPGESIGNVESISTFQIDVDNDVKLISSIKALNGRLAIVSGKIFSSRSPYFIEPYIISATSVSSKRKTNDCKGILS